MKTISNEGLNLIKRFEGCRLVAYDDLNPTAVLSRSSTVKGTLTIGWGHTGKDVYIGMTLTQSEADELLVKDLARYIAAVNNPANVPLVNSLTQSQFDALVSFCYNCGAGNLKTLCKGRSLTEISQKIPAYNKSGGKVMLGLTRRREAERLLFDRYTVAPKTEDTSLIALQKRIVSLEEMIIKLQSQSAPIEAPQWIIEEYPDILESMNDQTASYEVWRALIIILRHFDKSNTNN